MPRAREYSKKISIYSSGASPDGFGGNTITNFKLLDVFAKLETLDKFKYRNIDFGDIDMSNSLMVTIRKRSDFDLDYKNMYIVYRGYRYVISDRGINYDFHDDYIRFTALRQNEIVEGVKLFDIYQGFAQATLGETSGVLQSESCTISQIRALL